MRKISIIIPCYNVAPYIDRCMASIAVQTIGMDSLEIICIDDASTDDTWAHLRKWEQVFPDQIILIRQEINRRQGAARNLGLACASADWISFVDGDDWLEPDYFERLYRPVGKFKCDVIACRWKMDDSSSLTCFDAGIRSLNEEQYISADTAEITKQIFVERKLGMAAWGKLLRKGLLMEHGICFPEGLTYEDEYWIPLLHICASGLYVMEKPLYHYYINPRSVINSKNMDFQMDWITVQSMKWMEYERRGILKEYYEEIEYDLLSSTASLLSRIILQYDQPSFSYVRLLSEFIRGHVPDYKKNRYIGKLSEAHLMFLGILYSAAGRSELQQFTEQIQRIMES